MDQKGFDFQAAHLVRTALLMKQTGAAHPVNGVLIGVAGIVACTQNLACIVQQSQGWSRHRTTLGRKWQPARSAFSRRQTRRIAYSIGTCYDAHISMQSNVQPGIFACASADESAHIGQIDYVGRWYARGV